MANMTDSRTRWDTDDRFAGVADAVGGGADRAGPQSRMGDRGSEVYLRGAGVKGLRAAGCGTGQDGVLTVTAEHSPVTSGGGHGELLGAIAEPTTSVAENHDDDAVIFEVVTGVPEGEGLFASHGHAIQLTLRPTRLQRLRRG
jgi:hypothetical protein